MTARPLTPEDFPRFFSALWSYPPFDWQARLLRRVHSKGWPSTLDLPTGSGKTAVLDVALFALALDAFSVPGERLQARRIVLVVDRRVVVDQAYERAVKIAQALDQSKDGILGSVATALLALSGDPRGLPVLPAILRGGMPREAEWARTPSQPVILVSTVDQVGSRLLFRGYGVSNGMKPVHAGLLGQDSLYLLDEVHLARPFEETLSAIARWYGNSQTSTELLPRPLKFVRMSATVADERNETFFGLEEADRSHERLRERLVANKKASLGFDNTPHDPAKAGEALARAAVREVERLGNGTGRAVAVIVNRVNTARQVALLAQQRLRGAWTVQLLTGRMRPLDRVQLLSDLLGRVSSGRTRHKTDERMLLVSTQAVEAGADFDFDALVTECASLDALRQRFGRLDRLGQLTTSEAVILAGSSSLDEKGDPDPIYGDSLRNTWRWLNEIAEHSPENHEPVVDFGIEALAPKLGELDSEKLSSMLPPRGTAPVLVANYLDRWVQTSPVPSADPDIASFLHGIGRGAPEVQIVWRADLDEALLYREKQAAEHGSSSLPFVRGLLETVRPSALESLSVPLWAAARWLEAVAGRRRQDKSGVEGAATLTDVEGMGSSDDAAPDGMAPAVLWRGEESFIATRASDIRPGETVVVPATYGGLDPTFCCWDAEATETVRDRGDEAQLLHRGKAVIRWDPAVISAWSGELPVLLTKGPQVRAEDYMERGSRAEREAFQEWRLGVLDQPSTPEWARVVLQALATGESVAHFDIPREYAPDEDWTLALRTLPDQAADGETQETRTWRATWKAKRVPVKRLRSLLALPSIQETPIAGANPAEPATEGDEGSFLGAEISLSEHLQGVREFARDFARAIDLPEAIAEDVEMAAWLHDLGKTDPRFQVLLHGCDPVRAAAAAEPIAKSAVATNDRAARQRARERSGYPRGARHELMSVALIEENDALRARAHDWDLVLHLVASHHGWGRPFGPPVSDDSPVEVRTRFDGIELSGSSDHRLARIDSGIADRFWRLVRRYGWWGLAWLEAIVRLADHRESEREMAEADRNG
jgi:CRISPR-associated endonuclease/helicase Cas3